MSVRNLFSYIAHAMIFLICTIYTRAFFITRFRFFSEKTINQS